MKVTISDKLLPGETYIDEVFISPYLPGNQSTPKSDVIKYIKNADIIFPGLIICSNDNDCQADASVRVSDNREIKTGKSPHWNYGDHNHYKVSSQYGPSLIVAKTFLLLDNLLRYDIDYNTVVKTRILFSSDINQYHSWYYISVEADVLNSHMEKYGDKFERIEDDEFLSSYYRVLYDNVYAYPKRSDGFYEKYNNKVFTIDGVIYFICDNGKFIKSKWSYKLNSYKYDCSLSEMILIDNEEMEHLIINNNYTIELIEKIDISPELEIAIYKEEHKRS